jgi:hypothetical protein
LDKLGKIFFLKSSIENLNVSLQSFLEEVSLLWNIEKKKQEQRITIIIMQKITHTHTHTHTHIYKIKR